MPDDILLGLAVTTMAGLARLSHKELAIKIGVTQRTVSKWNQRRGGISDANLRRAARALNCSVDDLLALAADLRRWEQRGQIFSSGSKPASKQDQVAEVSPLDHFSAKELYYELGRLVARGDQVRAEIRARGFPI